MSLSATSLPLSSIKLDANQPRKSYSKEELQELADNIKVHGVINPIEVDSSYVILTGERRYRAAKLAGLKEIPVRIVENVKHRELRQLSENVFREGMQPLEEAQCLSDMLGKYKCTKYRIAKLLGKDGSWVSERLMLLEDPADIRELVRTKRITLKHAQVLRNAPKEYYKLLHTGMLQKQFSSSLTAQRCVSFLKRGGSIEVVKQIMEQCMPEPKAVVLMAKDGIEISNRVGKALDPGKRVIELAGDLALLVSQIRKDHIRIAPMQLPRIALALNAVNRELSPFMATRRIVQALKLGGDVTLPDGKESYDVKPNA